MTDKRSQRLPSIIETHGATLQPSIDWADARALLCAIAEVESQFGKCAVPRHETLYDFGGRYSRNDLLATWGAWAACSYSSFQIMYGTAVELGFDPERSPADLHEDEIAIYYVLAFIDKRILRKGCRSIRNFADAYNSGNFRDRIIPVQYIARFEKAYDEALPVVHSWA